MFKKTLFMKIIILIALGCSQAYATCTPQNGWSDKDQFYDIGTLIIQRDTPVGATIKTVDIPLVGGGELWATCSGGESFNSGYAIGWPMLANNIKQTNIPGVGVRISNTFGYSGLVVIPWGPQLITTTPMSVYWGNSNFYRIEFIKTATTTGNGNFTPGRWTYFSIYNEYYVSYLSISSGRALTVACSITTPSLIFPIGDVLASSFGANIGTIPVNAKNTQSLGLNCDSGANINVMLQGTQNPDVSTTSVLALTGQGNADVAKGVGVQLLYNDVPLELNNRIVLKQSTGGQETFPITARYYQTKTSVSTGKANASATLDLTYQ